MFNFKIMKKLISVFAIISALLLTGCAGSDGPALDGSVEGNTYSTSDFALEIPTDWEVISEFGEGYPENMIVAIRNNVKANSFISNMNVTYAEIEKGVDLGSYATQILDTHRSTLTNFREVGIEDLQITAAGDPASSVLNVFEGKRTPESQTLRFLQTYGYKANTVYVLTGMYNLSEEKFAREKVENTVRSFEIK